MYRPQSTFVTPVKLLKPSGTVTEKGKTITTYQKIEGAETIFCSLKTYGGTESTVDGILTVIDTADLETWYRPDIQSDCRIIVNEIVYEVMGKPENIEMRNQFLKFKIRAKNGRA